NAGSRPPTGGTGGLGGGAYLGGVSGLILDSTISGNQTGAGGAGSGKDGASGQGGGLATMDDGFSTPLTLSVRSSTISGNATGRALTSSAGGDGGGIYANSGLTL